MAIGLITTPASWVQGTPASPTWFQNMQDTLNAIQAGGRGFFGNGIEGDVIQAGTFSPLYGYDDLTLNSGANANLTSGYLPLLVGGTLTVNSGAKISANGGAGGNGSGAAGGTGGGQSTNTYRHCGGYGKAGQTASSTPTAPPSLMYGAGGLGGNGGAAGAGPGPAGSILVNTSLYRPWVRGELFFHAVNLALSTTPLLVPLSGGSGGGGGRGDATNGGGGGGEGGGFIIVIARRIVWNVGGTWEAIGGAGGNGHTTGNTDGGGGGGGGAALFIYESLTGSIPSGTVTGGAGGAKNGTGAVGAAGSSGTSTAFTLSVG